MEIKSKASLPAILIALFLVVSFFVIAIGHAISSQTLRFINTLDFPGLDYIDYFRASENILNHLNPYEIIHSRYVTTPIPALLNTIFVPFGFERARNMMFLLVVCSVTFGIFLSTSLFPFSKLDKKRILLGGFISLSLSYPFYFLLYRANIDGWVLLFLCSGLIFMQKSRKEWLSGCFFSLAIFFKIYPILILLPILLYRRWRVVMWCGIWLVLLGIASSFWLLDFRSTLLERSQSLLRLDENGSLYATTLLTFVLLGSLGVSFKTNMILISFIPMIVAVIYGSLISIMIYVDYKMGKNQRNEIASYALYLPFMVALPQTVYHYSFVVLFILVPTICHLWQRTPKRSLLLFLMTIGLCLTQWQAIASFNLTQNVFAHAIPGLGLLLLMATITKFKIDSLRKTQRTTPHPKEIAE
jgi:hypothetical protein